MTKWQYLDGVLGEIEGRVGEPHDSVLLFANSNNFNIYD